jgi:hypothetical protein
VKTILQPWVVYFVATAFLGYSCCSCASGSEASKALEKYDSYEYADEANFNRSFQETFRAAAASLEEMQFTLTVTDEAAGVIEAEDGREELRPEEESGEDSGAGILAFLLLIIVAIFALIVGGNESSDDQSDSSYEAPTPHKSFVYVVSLDVREDGPEAAIVRVGASRFDYEDADLVASKDLQNKRLNHGLFDRIEEHLRSDSAQVVH